MIRVPGRHRTLLSAAPSSATRGSNLLLDKVGPSLVTRPVSAPEGSAHRPAQPISARAGRGGRADLIEPWVLKSPVWGPYSGLGPLEPHVLTALTQLLPPQVSSPRLGLEQRDHSGNQGGRPPWGSRIQGYQESMSPDLTGQTRQPDLRPLGVGPPLPGSQHLLAAGLCWRVGS